MKVDLQVGCGINRSGREAGSSGFLWRDERILDYYVREMKWKTSIHTSDFFSSVEFSTIRTIKDPLNSTGFVKRSRRSQTIPAASLVMITISGKQNVDYKTGKGNISER